jgi:predicted phage terminase large subunit-like protein
MAFKDNAENDFVCGQLWGKARENYYLREEVYGHLDFPGTLKAVKDFTKAHPNAAAKWVEDKANGPAVIATLRNEISGLIAVDPQGGKEARAHAVSPRIESGNVFLPHPALVGGEGKENWVTQLIENAASFPNALHDDDVDALTQALNKLRSMPGAASHYGTIKARS